jgi:hypothetical protein
MARLIATSLLLLVGCGGREIQTSTTSPNSQYVAEVVLIRGFTHYIELVSIRSVKPSLQERVFGSEKDLFRLSSGGKLSVNWNSNTNLFIKCNPCDYGSTTIFEDHWRDVSVTYDVAPLQWKREDDPKAR